MVGYRDDKIIVNGKRFSAKFGQTRLEIFKIFHRDLHLTRTKYNYYVALDFFSFFIVTYNSRWKRKLHEPCVGFPCISDRPKRYIIKCIREEKKCWKPMKSFKKNGQNGSKMYPSRLECLTLIFCENSRVLRLILTELKHVIVQPIYSSLRAQNLKNN